MSMPPRSDTAPRIAPLDLESKTSGLPAGIAHKAIPFEVKAVSDPAPGGPPDDFGSFEGLGGVFLNLDSDGDILDPGAFDGALKSFLADGFIGGVGHDWANPIGHPVEARPTAEGLYLKAVFDGSPDAQAVRAKMRVHPASGRSTIRKLSIGYVATAAERFKAPADVRSYWEAKGYAPSGPDLARLDGFFAPRPDRDGKPFVPGVRLLRAVKLYEVSPVVVPANEQAEVTGAKGALLGDTDQAVAFAALDRLQGLLCSFLWMALADCRPYGTPDGVAPDPPTPLAERLDRMRAGCDEFRDALVSTLEVLLAEEDGSGATATPDAGETAVEVGAKSLRERLALPAGDDPRIQQLESLRTKAVAAPAPTFADHSRQVVSAVQEFLARAGARTEARVKEGRMLSRANLDEIGSVADLMQSGHDRLRALLSKASGPAEKAADPVPATAPPPEGPGAREKAADHATPDESKAAVPPDEIARLFHRYIDLEATVLGLH
jgi:HK97 family phage prohead protease